MKSIRNLAAPVLVLLSGALASAQNLTGLSLRIGTENEFADDCIVVGQANDLSASNSWFKASRSAVIGIGNAISAEDSLVVGGYNSSDYSEDLDGDAESSGVFGMWNWIVGDRSLAVGTRNQIVRQYTGQGGSSDWVKPVNAVAMGTGLINRFDNCTMVGKNNVSVSPTAPHTGPAPLFIVANGSSTTNRSNAFEVRDNGDIIISKPQGDISMGIYGD